MIRTALLVLAVIAALSVSSVLRQRYHCEQAWRDCRPTMFPCEPVGKLLEEKRYLEEQARRQRETSP
ncbi:MAG: hypothetical protein FWD79_05600 [Desulfobulbus sp.]|nr:hypothetical protein [Desulfobulbus sp.]